MKRILTLALAVVMMLGCVATFTACSEDDKLNFGKELVPVGSQLDALNGLLKGDADIAVIDSVMAGYYMSTGDTFQSYQILDGVVLADEEYGIGAKKGNNALIGKINEAIIALADTDYKTVAQAYGLEADLLAKADTQNPQKDATDSSWADVVSRGKIIIGYTEFAPIAYHEGDGNDKVFKGFDIDLAKAVINYLNTKYSTNVEIEFKEIVWDNKEADLNTGNIDLVWNGMTITQERQENMAMSIPYLANKQVAVVKKADVDKYGKIKDEFVQNTADCIIIVEKGSAGEGVVHTVE